MGIREMVPRNNFFFAASFLLPDWEDEEDCPWCQELEMLKGHPALLDRHSELRDRYDLLASKTIGINRELFLRWGPSRQPWASSGLTREDWDERSKWLESAEPRTEIDLSFDLGPGSVFGTPTEADLFATVASSIQVLRSEGKLHTDEYQQPLAKVLDPYLYARGRYYDPIILAAVLRASRRHDLRSTAVEKLLRRAMAEKLQYAVYRELRAELLLAIGQGKLPRPYELRTDRSLFSGGQEGIVAWLQALVAAPTTAQRYR
jgi:hypothetical protein